MNAEGQTVIRDWAERFWLLAGQSEAFPRTLETSVLRALPLIIVKLPRLDGEAINEYAKLRGLNLSCQSTSRALRGCLLAKSGSGIVFLEGADPPDELRFTLAHEVAHFLLDHLHPRHQIINALGSDIQDVLDGLREPSPQEQMNAMLKGVAFGRFEHFMDRQTDGKIASRETLLAEDRADRLALELLAPLQCVEESLTAKAATFRDVNAIPLVKQILREEYGLPRDVARNYARFFVTEQTPPPTFGDWLREKKSP